MTTGLIICGALAREVLAFIERHGWDAEVAAVPATLHLFPDRIPPAVEKRIEELHGQYDRLICVYGDCGTGGALDAALDRMGIERIDGPHCYEWYGGETFNDLMAEEPGTYFLTDFMVRQFRNADHQEHGPGSLSAAQAGLFRQLPASRLPGAETGP